MFVQIKFTVSAEYIRNLMEMSTPKQTAEIMRIINESSLLHVNFTILATY